MHCSCGALRWSPVVSFSRDRSAQKVAVLPLGHPHLPRRHRQLVKPHADRVEDGRSRSRRPMHARLVPAREPGRRADPLRARRDSERP